MPRSTAHLRNAFNAFTHRPPVPIPTLAAISSSSSLHGITVAVKDMFWTRAMPTTAASRMLEGLEFDEDATAVRLLREAGAELVGKTNCDEFGMGSANLHSAYGPVLNPSPSPDAEPRLAGGSSGGSAAAVATRECFAALATDTGGSIRLPASHCGVVGLKPSYGLVSRHGVVSYAESLDCVGVMARSVDGVRKVFNAVNQHDPRDPTSASSVARSRARSSLPSDRRSLRIGIPQEYFPTSPSPSFRRLLRLLKSQHAGKVTLVPVSLPRTPLALSAYYVLASAEAASGLARYDGVQFGQRSPEGTYAATRTEAFGDEVKRRILLGTYALTAGAFDNYYLQAQRVRSLIRRDFNRVFSAQHALLSSSPVPPQAEAVDVLLHPTAVRPPPLLYPSAEDEAAHDPEENYLQDVLTTPASLAGLPAMSVPAGRGEEGWPAGVSVVGQWGQEETVFDVAEIVEEVVRGEGWL